MSDADKNELIVEAVRDFQRGCIKIELAIAEDPTAEDETIGWLRARVNEVRALCDFLHPPKPCWAPNVVPLWPRRVG